MFSLAQGGYALAGARATELAGIKGKTTLVELGLEALITKESARRLAKLGGTEKKLKAIPRRRIAEEALRLSQKNREEVEGRSRILLGRILGRTEPSQTHKAEESILKGIEVLQELQMKPSYAEGCLWLGELYLNTGKRQKALQNLKKADTMFRDMGMDYWLSRTQELLGPRTNCNSA